MSVFLIDYENLHTSAFSGLEDLTEDDRVLIFYTNNSDNLTFSLMQRLNGAKAGIEYMKVSCGGKNSLDFQLCSYLGYLIGTNSDTDFCIVSRDKGYNTMLSLWGDKTENGNTVVCGVTIRNGMGRNPAMPDGALTAEALDTASAGEAAAEQPLTEETLNVQPSAEQPLAEQPSAEQPSAEQPSAEQSLAEQPSAEQPLAEQSQTEQPQAEQSQTEQSPEKPKRKYNRRAPYKRKPKPPVEQTA